MRRISGRFPSFPNSTANPRILKFVLVVSTVLLILLLELLRVFVLEESPSVISESLFLIAYVILAILLYRLVFGFMERGQQEDLRRGRELGILSEIALMVIESRNLNELLPQVMEKLLQVTRADSGELFLIDARSRGLSCALHVGIPTETPILEASPLTQDMLVNELARSSEPVMIEDIENSENPFSSVLAYSGFRSLIIVPLNSKSGIVGIFVILSSRPGHFKSNEVNLLTNIGNHIAIAIENARLSENVQAMAIVEERERIAKELHDGLAQVLGYVITKSQATRQILRKMDEAIDYLVELEKIAQDVYTDTREDILGLRASIEGDRDMVSAIRRYLARFSQMHGIRTTLEVGDQIIPSLAPQAELQAIRIVQEALSNIRKHAEATHALIKVAASENEVTFVIEDDGKGFDMAEIRQSDYSKFGIRTIRERAESIHARLEIESRTGHGTKVTLSIPVSLPKSSEEQFEYVESTDS